MNNESTKAEGEIYTLHGPHGPDEPDHVHRWTVYAIGQVLLCCGPTQKPARVCDICGIHQVFSAD